MQFKEPKNTDRHYWTKHIQMKMRQYGISEGRVKRILRAPMRTETGVADETVAVMQPLSTRWDPMSKERTWKQELWLMYQMRAPQSMDKNESVMNDTMREVVAAGKNAQKQCRLISVWRYPGVTKPGDGIPEEILADLLAIE